jgi:plastocyanin
VAANVVNATPSAEPRAVRPLFPLSTPTIATLLALSTVLFLVFPSPLWRAARDESHLLRFAFSYFAIVPLAALALHRQRRFRLDSLVTIVAMVWGAKLVVTAVLYQTVGTSRRAELHAPDPNASAPPAIAAPPAVADASPTLATLTGHLVDRDRAVAGAIVAVCNASFSDSASPVDRAASIRAGALSPMLLDATVGDPLTFTNTDAAPHAVRGIASGVSAMSLAVVPGRVSTIELSTVGPIALESDGRPIGAVVVFDHALHTRTDAEGRFELVGVPIGPRALCVFVGPTAVRHLVHAVVGDGTDATFDIGSAS